MLSYNTLWFTYFLIKMVESKSDFHGHYACGELCRGTPQCGKTRCGNVNDMCYCECKFFRDQSFCKTSELGYKWNGGKLKKDQNGKMGDGRAYKC